MKNLKLHRIISLVAALAFVCAVIFSVMFISAETIHDCHDADCQTCEMLIICHAFVKSVAEVTAIAIVVVAVSSVLIKIKIVVQAIAKNISLVFLKIKLSI